MKDSNDAPVVLIASAQKVNFASEKLTVNGFNKTMITIVEHFKGPAKYFSHEWCGACKIKLQLTSSGHSAKYMSQNQNKKNFGRSVVPNFCSAAFRRLGHNNC